MGFRFQKRIKLGKSFGLNISKSGIRPSYRGKKGSISSKGLSLKTGIPGLVFRKTFTKQSKNGCFGVFLMLFYCFRFYDWMFNLLKKNIRNLQ